MILVVLMKDGVQLYEEIRTAEVNLDKLVYFRSTFYAGEEHSIDIGDIKYAYIVAHGKEIYIVLDKK